MDQPSIILETAAPPATPATPAKHEVPFGVNEMRLSAREWLAVIAIVAACILATPRLWKKLERFDTAADYRVPYQLSKDYWLYERRLDALEGSRFRVQGSGNTPSSLNPAGTLNPIPVLGDSVIWGEYVRPDGTLPHFLSAQAAQPGRFVNCGVNGLFPLAMEGLVEHYATALHHRKIILHCNVLWMSSPKADLRIQKEETFNHARLVPQFTPRIPCYRADASERLSVLIERNVGFSAWVGHLQNVYFEQKSIPNWTLMDDGGNPPQYPNAWKDPLRQITMVVPGEPAGDPQRGPASARHKPWNAEGASPARFDWVDLDSSLQWHAFQRVVTLLRGRGNDVLVVLGPFNEHMIAEEQRPTYRAMCNGIAAWLAQNHIPHVVPDTLPSAVYADASHPLTAGYDLLAGRIFATAAFQQWLAAPR
jgi:hypothetical protein